MFDLKRTLEIARTSLAGEGIGFALIGGFALGAYGIHRATDDIDLLVDGSKREAARSVLVKNGFALRFESKEVMQFEGPGYLDLLLANRPLTLEMLSKPKTELLLGLPVVAVEGLIGLKIQAFKNDPQRRLQELADIEKLLAIKPIDLGKVKVYADLFDAWPEIKALVK